MHKDKINHLSQHRSKSDSSPHPCSNGHLDKDCTLPQLLNKMSKVLSREVINKSRAITLLNHIEAELLAHDRSNIKISKSVNDASTQVNLYNEQQTPGSLLHSHVPSRTQLQASTVSNSKEIPAFTPIPRPPSLLLFPAQNSHQPIHISKHLNSSLTSPKANIRNIKKIKNEGLVNLFSI
ncbi:hypothetical protein AVEN_143387-1 [Araneus ventricosus]|uniref:Uncharacterized protein n=1 Tax=Araneus ventricosus TaxID=182803 RepID=A0A4Y2AE25_ARAVE|nr:hypothetical protein AVEN_143387-1 [Araneus ventricosus]